MATHHAGPWAYRPTFEGQWAVGLPSDVSDRVGTRGDEYMYVTGICTEADARLMAAAPELLQAAQLALRRIESSGDDALAVLALRTAIQRATGVEAKVSAARSPAEAP